MKIRFEELTAQQRVGGIEAAVTGLVSALEEKGVKVSRSALDRESLRATRLPDCVHFHGIWSPVLMSRLRAWRRAGVPCVGSPHGMLQPWALGHKRWKKLLAWHLYQRRLLNQFQILHGTSALEVEQFSDLGISIPTEMIPWGVHLPEQPSNTFSPNRERIAVFVGRICPVKGLPLLVEAWSRIRPAGWKMLLVGPDEAGHRAQVEAAIFQHRLNDVFEFTGELRGRDKDEVYCRAQLFILPSYTENFGLAVAEALAHGLPVLATQGTPWSGLIRERCGWWVPASVTDIAMGLQHACSLRPEELSSMGERGRVWMARDFSWDQVAVRMRAMYESLIGP